MSETAPHPQPQNPEATQQAAFHDMEAQQQLAEHAKWQLAVGSTPHETGAKPSENGITAEDIAYNMWLESNAQEAHAGQSLRGKLKAEAEGQEAAKRREQMKEFAKLEMRVKTGQASGDEMAYYHNLKASYDETRNKKQAEEQAKVESVDTARHAVEEAIEAPKTEVEEPVAEEATPPEDQTAADEAPAAERATGRTLADRLAAARQAAEAAKQGADSTPTEQEPIILFGGEPAEPDDSARIGRRHPEAPSDEPDETPESTPEEGGEEEWGETTYVDTQNQDELSRKDRAAARPKKPGLKDNLKSFGRRIKARVENAGYYLADDYGEVPDTRSVGERVRSIGKPEEGTPVAGALSMEQEADRQQELVNQQGAMKKLREDLLDNPDYDYKVIGDPESGLLNDKDYEKRISELFNQQNGEASGAVQKGDKSLGATLAGAFAKARASLKSPSAKNPSSEEQWATMSDEERTAYEDDRLASMDESQLTGYIEDLTKRLEANFSAPAESPEDRQRLDDEYEALNYWVSKARALQRHRSVSVAS